MAKTWRLEFTEDELSEIYYAVIDKAQAPVTDNDKKWKKELKQIAQKIVDAGIQV